MKKTTFILSDIVSIVGNEMTYYSISGDKKGTIKAYKVELYKPFELKFTGNSKMDNFIEKANAKIMECIKDLNEPSNYADKVDGTNEYAIKKQNSITTFTARKVNTIKTLVIFSKLDINVVTDSEYEFMIAQTALDRKTDVQAYDGMTIAEFYGANGAIKKSLNEFIEILADKGLRFSPDFTHIELL